MNYIELLNAFWRYNRLNPFTSHEISMYMALLAECNEQYWPSNFCLPPGFFKRSISQHSSTIIRVRQRLIDKGFISYEIIDGVGYYTIVDRNKTATSAGNPAGNPVGNPVGNQNANHTSYIENKNKDKDLSLSYDMEISKESENEDGMKVDMNNHAVIQVPDAESTFWHCKKIAKSKEYANFLSFLEKNAPFVATHLVTLSEDQFLFLREKFGKELLTTVVINLENRRDLCSRYSNMYYTLTNWCEHEQKRLSIA